MRLISPGANPPADVDKYLLPHEQEVITVRKHPAVLLAPIAWAVLGLVAAAVLSDTLFRHSSTLTWVVWAAWGVIFLRSSGRPPTGPSTTSWSPRTGSSRPRGCSPARSR